MVALCENKYTKTCQIIGNKLIEKESKERPLLKVIDCKY